MKTLIELSDKSAGQLIKHEDWNDLVSHVGQLQTALSDGLLQVATQVGDLDQRFGTFEDTLAGLGQTVDTLTRGRLRITLTTTRRRYLIGERSEIEARVTDLLGQPIDVGALPELPWIDFATVWGRFRAMPGTTSRGGSGGRSMAVRLDPQGVARVHLLAEQGDGLSRQVEDEVSAAFDTRLPQADNLSLRSHLLATATPTEALNSGAFKVLSQEYLRTDAVSVQHFVDTYFQAQPRFRLRAAGRLLHRWRDYRTTVLAFVKTDADSQTADLSHGGTSVEVSFRDWTAPWLAQDFFGSIDDVVQRAGQQITTLTATATNVASGLGAIQDSIRRFIANQGAAGKQRALFAYRLALDRFAPAADPPIFVAQIVGAARSSVDLQRSLEDSALAGESEQVGLDVVARFALADATGGAGSQSRLVELEGELTVLEEQVGEALAQATGLTERTAVVEGRTAELDSRFGRIDSRFSGIDSSLQNLALVANRATDSQVAALDQRVERDRLSNSTALARIEEQVGHRLLIDTFENRLQRDTAQLDNLRETTTAALAEKVGVGDLDLLQAATEQALAAKADAKALKSLQGNVRENLLALKQRVSGFDPRIFELPNPVVIDPVIGGGLVIPGGGGVRPRIGRQPARGGTPRGGGLSGGGD